MASPPSLKASSPSDSSKLYPKKKTFLSQILPASLYLYVEVIRLEKPTGIILSFWPYAWGVILAVQSTKMSVLACTRWFLTFLLGIFLLRSTACILNDILDRKVDREVARTRNRPIASGRLSVFSASVFLAFMYVACIYYYWNLNNTKAFYLGLFSLFPLATLYPLFKRVTYWPQAWLGVLANWGLPVAYVTLQDSLNYRLLLPLFAGAWCWTMHYDTIYACQDKADDAKAGVGSTALRFGMWVKPILTLLSCAFVVSLIDVGRVVNQGWLYYVCAVAGAAAHLVWQLITVDLDNPKSCGDMFRNNSFVGATILVGLWLNYLRETRVI